MYVKITDVGSGPRHDAFVGALEILSGYQSGFDLVSGNQTEAAENFVALIVRGSPRLLLPSEPVAMRAAVKSFLGGRRYAKAITPLVSITSKVGKPLADIATRVSLISNAS